MLELIAATGRGQKQGAVGGIFKAALGLPLYSPRQIVQQHQRVGQLKIGSGEITVLNGSCQQSQSQ